MRRFPYFLIAVLVAFLVGCSDRVSGGSTEETNALAGGFLDPQGHPMAGAVVSLRQLDSESGMPLGRSAEITLTLLSWVDTTDADGKFRFQGLDRGRFALHVTAGDSLGHFQVIELDSSIEMIPDTMHALRELQFQLVMGTESASGIRVGIPGTDLSVISDSNGMVLLSGIPQGKVPLRIASPDQERFASVVWICDAAGEEPQLSPAMPENLWSSVLQGGLMDSLRWTPIPSTLSLPVNPYFGMRGEWNFDYLRPQGGLNKFFDSRGYNAEGTLYGGEAVEGVEGSALGLRADDDFGVLEEDGRLLRDLSGFGVEAWLRLDTVPVGIGSWNILGKVGFDSLQGGSIFSLALSQGECGSEGIRASWILSDSISGAMNCATTATASVDFPSGRWVHLLASWSNDTATLFQDGIEVARVQIHARMRAEVEEPLFFGKSAIRATLDGVRVLGYASLPVDAEWRHSAQVLSNTESP